MFRKLIKIMYKLIKPNDILSKIKLQPGDIAIDCGANVGNITAKMARKGVIVYAFEPNPYAFQILKKRFLKSKNVYCLNQGVYDKNDRLRLYLHKNAYIDQIKWSTGSSLLSFKSNINPQAFIDIELIDLSQFIKNLNRKIKLLKIDVEGVECQIINKLIDTRIIECIDCLIAETHDKKVPELKIMTNKLKKRIIEEKLLNINLRWH